MKYNVENFNKKVQSLLMFIYSIGHESFDYKNSMNKNFFLNPEKNLAQIRLNVFEKNAKLPSRRLGYSNK